MKVGSNWDLRILTGNEFQTLGAENGKARDPQVVTVVTVTGSPSMFLFLRNKHIKKHERSYPRCCIIFHERIYRRKK